MMISTKIKWCLCASLFSLCILTACTNLETYDDPEQILNLTLEQMDENEQMALYGTTEASISGYALVEAVQMDQAAQDQDQQLASWNTLLNMKQLKQIKKEVTIEQDLSNENQVFLNIQIDSEAFAEVIKDNLLSNLEQIERTYLTGSTEERLAAKKNAIVQARGGLEEMLQHLSVQGVYQMGVERNTYSPQTLYVNTVLSYQLKGEEKQEKVTGSYEFGIFDKDVVIPQNL
jgi:6-pyruvoyl-tetrahydropterin synthase